MCDGCGDVARNIAARRAQRERLPCNADGIPHDAHDWDFGSGEVFRCEGYQGGGVT